MPPIIDPCHQISISRTLREKGHSVNLLRLGSWWSVSFWGQRHKCSTLLGSPLSSASGTPKSHRQCHLPACMMLGAQCSFSSEKIKNLATDASNFENPSTPSAVLLSLSSATLFDYIQLIVGKDNVSRDSWDFLLSFYACLMCGLLNNG